MQSFKAFFTGIIRKPPILFPIVGLFHILWLLWTIWDDRHVPFPDVVWLELVWMVGYTTFWLAACDLRKWGALGYVLLTMLDVLFSLAAYYGKIGHSYPSNMFLLDVVFSMFILFYYKRFGKQS